MKWLTTSESTMSASMNWVTTEPKRLRAGYRSADLLFMPARRQTHRDPYYRCEMHCNHDLGRGMSVAELLGDNDPHPAGRANASPSPTALATPAAPRHPARVRLPGPAGS